MELETISTDKKKLSHYILGNARTLVMVFILFAIMVVMTTDIRMATISDVRDFGSEFFLLLFGSYGMYICCADSGSEAGLKSEIYKKTHDTLEEHRSKIEETMLPRMGEFCAAYIEKELRNARMHYLAVVCIPYEVYIEKYVTLGKAEINATEGLSSAQRKAIIRANKVKPIKLTPEMLLSGSEGARTRSGLSINPRTMKNIFFSIKMAKMSFTSVCMSLIAMQVIFEPSWAVFAEVCMKLVTVVINGFDGYKEGFKNITVYTVNYENTQSNLMRQATQYIDGEKGNEKSSTQHNSTHAEGT